MNSNKISIIGAGQAAIYAAMEIRKLDDESSITLYGDENYLPYERPPLSKDFLINKKKEDEILFFNKQFFEDKKISFANKKITKVDFKNNILTSYNDDFLYDKLLITTGSTNRKLEVNSQIDNDIYYLRNLDEAVKIKDKALKVNKIAII